VPMADEVPTAPAVGEGSGISTAGEGSGTLMAGKGSATAAAGVGSYAGVITRSRPPDDGEGAESSSKATTTSPPLGPAMASSPRTA
jgi:hypothetical protein